MQNFPSAYYFPVPSVPVANYISFNIVLPKILYFLFRVFFFPTCVTELIMCILSLLLKPSYILSRRASKGILSQCSLLRNIYPSELLLS